MEIDLDPRYRNYWLDLARKEKKEKEDAQRKKAIADLLNVIGNKNKKKP